MSAFSVESLHEERTWILVLAGQLDAPSTPVLDREGEKLIAAEAKAVVLDLAELESVGSAGLRSILQILKAVQADGGQLRIACPKSPARKVLDVSGFSSLVPVHDDRTSAVQGLWDGSIPS
jgi:anti-anti-sigma factor